ncbi:hypothetical protein D9M69_513910 [compost metagenome]
MEATGAVQGRHDHARQRPAQNPGDGRGGHERAERLGAPRGRVPVGGVEDDAGVEARFEGTEQEAQDVELGRRGDERLEHADGAPANGDAHDGLLCADLLQQGVGGHLEEEVAEEEDARPQAIDRLAEPQHVEHLQLGEPDVHPVQPRQYPQDAQEGKKPP